MHDRDRLVEQAVLFPRHDLQFQRERMADANRPKPFAEVHDEFVIFALPRLIQCG